MFVRDSHWRAILDVRHFTRLSWSLITLASIHRFLSFCFNVSKNIQTRIALCNATRDRLLPCLDFNVLCTARVVARSTCASGNCCGTIAGRIVATEGEHSKASWNALRMMDPWKRFTKNDALATFLEGEVSVFFFSKRSGTTLNTLLFCSATQFLWKD